MSDLPQNQVDAVQWLLDRGGKGSFCRYGSVVANGEMSVFSWATRKALHKARLVEFYDNDQRRVREPELTKLIAHSPTLWIL